MEINEFNEVYELLQKKFEKREVKFLLLVSSGESGKMFYKTSMSVNQIVTYLEICKAQSIQPMIDGPPKEREEK